MLPRAPGASLGLLGQAGNGTEPEEARVCACEVPSTGGGLDITGGEQAPEHRLPLGPGRDLFHLTPVGLELWERKLKSQVEMLHPDRATCEDPGGPGPAVSEQPSDSYLHGGRGSPL